MGGQVVKNGSSILESGRRVIYLVGGVCCVGTGGGAGLCNFGKRAACLCFLKEARGVCWQVVGHNSLIYGYGRRALF